MNLEALRNRFLEYVPRYDSSVRELPVPDSLEEYNGRF